MKLKLGTMGFSSPCYFEGIPNLHLYVTGISGQGKTYLLRNLAMQMEDQGARVIILDFSGDFVKPFPEQQWEPEVYADIVDLKSGDYGLELFAPWDEEETTEDIGDRVLDMINAGMRLTQTQWALLSDVIQSGLDEGILKSMKDLYLLLLAKSEEDDVAKRLLSRMRTLARLVPSGGKPVDWRSDTPGMTIVNLSKYRDKTSRIIVTEMLLNTICSLRMNKEPEEGIPIVTLVDECQHLRFRESDQEVRILREGRKYSIFGWFATQWLSDKTAIAALGQAGLHIYFRPADEELHKVALKLTNGDRKMLTMCETKLSNLNVGEFLFRERGRIITVR